MAFANFRGVYIKGCRNALKKAEIVDLKKPTLFCVPTKLGSGSESKIMVKVGDVLKAGGILASPSDKTSSFIYSPTSGSVVEISSGLNAFGEHCKFIKIEPSKKDFNLLFKPLTDKSKTNLFGRLVESGSCDTWGERFPSYYKYTNKNSKNLSTLIVKLYDSDGYIFSNAAIAKNFAKQVAMGALLYLNISGANELVFVVFDCFNEITSKIKQELMNLGQLSGNISFYRAKRNYPGDYSNLLANTVTKKVIKITQRVEENGVCIENAQTCLNFYNAVYENKPVISTLYTISGTNFKKPMLAFVKNGAICKDVLNEVKKEETVLNSFVVGGALCGVAQCSFENGLPLSATSLHSFYVDENNFNEVDCINCGKCNRVCPVRLAPVLLDNYALEKDYGRAKKYGAQSCINCGLCSYVCPAKRFVSQRISDMKTAIDEGRTM